MNKKVNGWLNIEVNIECPNCGELLDLNDPDEFPYLGEEGLLLNEVFDGDRWGTGNLDETVECPYCKTKIDVGMISW